MMENSIKRFIYGVASELVGFITLAALVALVVYILNLLAMAYKL